MRVLINLRVDLPARPSSSVSAKVEEMRLHNIEPKGDEYIRLHVIK